ncbi:hypothetical protein [Allonocardiopsis opalescens]|uniref:CdiI immunity protein domain-containing protein n=1 Tax=Allonocardiopsis opalescens TaxID=1144618 RepID=A0A2T0Q3Q5_9ACTN|nr:hypothetical protein [Allonocardiopsis opalescens]PRX98432.1 hypothetical protein CLV72_1048 [Allonocardiopsis opalescens]
MAQTAADDWRVDPWMPYRELLHVVEWFYNPDVARPDGPAALRRLVYAVEHRGAVSSRHDIPRFLAELRSALHDPGRVRPGALKDAAAYTDEDDAAFLVRVWCDIYPDRPCPLGG